MAGWIGCKETPSFSLMLGFENPEDKSLLTHVELYGSAAAELSCAQLLKDASALLANPGVHRSFDYPPRDPVVMPDMARDRALFYAEGSNAQAARFLAGCTRFEDKPPDSDAWDIDFYYTEKCEDIAGLESVEVDELGPVQGALRLVRRFGGSEIEQRIVIYADIPRIDFVTNVDWREKEKLLKVAFPVTINSPTARYEIQFGNIERPTHSSTSWDFARFEVCGHKWADLSEGGYGVSLLNDCKYGYDIRENVMRLTLLRATIDPDPTADRGEHTFTYSLYPHQGDYASGGTVRAGYEMNVPLRTYLCSPDAGELPASVSMFRLDSDHVVLDTVKKSEADDSIILRFYEAHNKRGRVSLSTDLLVEQAWECDLVERNISQIDTTEGVISFDIAPFEIKTIKVAVN